MAAQTFHCPKCQLAFISKIRGTVICRRCGTSFSTVAKHKEGEDKSPPLWLLLVRPITGLVSALSRVADENSAAPVKEDRRSRHAPTDEPSSRKHVLVGGGVLIAGVAAAAISFWPGKKPTTATPDDSIVQKIKEVSPLSEPNNKQANATQILDQLKSQQAPDLEVLVDQLQNRELGPGIAEIRLPKLEETEKSADWTITASLLDLNSDEQKRQNLIVDRYLQFRRGQLQGEAGQQAMIAFQQLGADAIPALVRGFNQSASKGEDCGDALVQKLQSAIATSSELELLTYANANLGKGVTRPTYQTAINSLKKLCMARVQVARNETLANLPQLINGLDHPDPNVRRQATDAIGKLGPRASTAIPDLAKKLNDPDAAVQSHAARALADSGPQGVPALVSALKDPKTSALAGAALAEHKALSRDILDALLDLLQNPAEQIRRAVRGPLRKLGATAVPALIAALQNKGQRNEAAHVLGEIGPPAAPAVPGLIMGLKDGDGSFRNASHRALVMVGPPAVSALIEAINEKDAVCWYHALVALGKIGAAAKEAIPALVDATKDPNAGKRMLAITALMQIDPEHVALGEHHAELLPVLIETLKHRDIAVRAWASESLGKLGIVAKSAGPQLQSALRDADPLVRGVAASALARVAPDSPETLVALRSALADTDSGVRKATIRALASLGTKSAPSLVQGLKDPSEQVTSGSRDALIAMGRPAVPALLGAFKGNDRSLRPEIARIWFRIGPAAVDAVPDLCESLKDSKDALRPQYVDTLQAIQPPATTLLATLLPLIKDQDEAFSQGALRALQSAKFDRAGILPLTRAIKDSDPTMRRAAASLLAKMGPEAREAVPSLVGDLEDADHSARIAVIQALAAIEPTAPSGLPFLIKALKENHGAIADAAQQALIKAGSTAVPDLRDALNDAQPTVKIRCLQVLEQIGPDAQVALPAVLALVNDSNAGVRQQVLEAARAIDGKQAAVLQVCLERFNDSSDEVRRVAQLALVRAAQPAVPLLSAALKRKEPEFRRGSVETLKKIVVDGTLGVEARKLVGELVAAMKDSDKQTRDGAAWALAEIDTELKSGISALRRLITETSAGSGSIGEVPKELRYLANADLLRLAQSERGSRLKPILAELKLRRGDEVMATLALATCVEDMEIQQLARKHVADYLADRLTPKEEEQAAARLSLYKQIAKSGKEDAAQQRLRELIRDLSQTNAAEEARKLLLEKK